MSCNFENIKLIFFYHYFCLGSAYKLSKMCICLHIESELPDFRQAGLNQFLKAGLYLKNPAFLEKKLFYKNFLKAKYIII